MEDIEQMKNDILKSLGQENNPVGILLTSYLEAKINKIMRSKLIEFQCFMSELDLIEDHNWSFETVADEFLSEL
jgi:hypothetical protein